MKELQDYCIEFIVPQRDKPKEFGGSTPWCRIEDIQGKYLNGTTSGHYVTNDTIKKMNLKVIPKGAVICACSASLGVQAILTTPCITNQTFIGIVPKEDLNNEFLYYFLKSKSDYFKRIGTGTTIPYISRKKFEQLLVPELRLDEQLYVVEILKHAESLVELRKQELQKLDNLIKARFVEMFGDLENTIRLGDCCEVHARIGWQALTKDEHRQTGEYMLVTGTDFVDGKVNFDTCVYVDKDRFEMDQHIILKENDVLITKDGTIGKVAVVRDLPKPATLNAGVFVVRPDERFNKEYISFVFRGPLFDRFVELSKTGATIKHLNQKHLVEFMIPVPSTEEQEKFAEFSKQLDKSKFVNVNILLKQLYILITGRFHNDYN